MELTLDEALAAGKDFEQVVLKADPMYKDLLQAIEIVKQFIIENNCIIYGGTAIDYALRLRGGSIYSNDSLLLPDLDFYCKDHINKSYDLADILYAAGWSASRAITGMHAETQRVDPGDNHFIADITYLPDVVYDIIPTLNYSGMKILEPLYQRIDLHSSLSFPYDGVPREVIFERWKKDIVRFNKINDLYPIDEYLTVPDIKLQKVSMPIHMKRSLLTGFVGYSLLCQVYLDFCKARDLAVAVQVSGLDLTTDYITFSAPIAVIELIDINVDKRVAKFDMVDISHYEKLFNLHMRNVTGTIKNTATRVIIYDNETRILSSNTVVIKEKSLRAANIQYQLKSCLANYFICRKQENMQLANYYLLMYKNLMTMISVFEEHLTPEEAVHHPFMLSVDGYGNANLNETTKTFLKKIEFDLGRGPQVKLPTNYYPEKNKLNNRPRPVPEYSEYMFIHENGTKVDAFV